MPLCEITPCELAWLAGLVEGEGYFTIQRYPGKDHWASPVFGLEMTDQDVVYRAQALTGVGSISSRTPRPRAKRSWTWQVRARQDVLDLMEVLYPYMGERRSERIDELLTLFGRPSLRGVASHPQAA